MVGDEPEGPGQGERRGLVTGRHEGEEVVDELFIGHRPVGLGMPGGQE